MSVNTTLAGLSQTPASNGPDGTTDAPSTLDDAQRYALSFIALLRDGKASAAEVDVASAGTCDIGAANSPLVRITGTTTITSLGTNFTGPRFIRFAGALTLTYNATTLILPGGANILTAAGDTCIAIPLAAGWYVTQYTRAVSSMIRLNTANGYGSTSTKIRRFTTTASSTGADITYADSATLGASFTINTAGVYAINYTDNYSAADGVTLTLNETTPTAAPLLAETLALSVTPAANQTAAAAWTGYLAAGSVIRARSFSGTSTGAAFCLFTIARVS